MFLRWYLTKLNSDPTRMEYWEYLDKVGYVAHSAGTSRSGILIRDIRLMHVGRGRRFPLHVDYIFLGACLGYIQDSIMEAVLSHPKLQLQRKIAIVKAINKVIWIQNDLLAKWHTKGIDDEFDSSNEQRQEEVEEPEGYLHGKKVLGDGSSGSEDDSSIRTTSSSGKTSLGRNADDTTSSFAGCPFSGMTIGAQRAEMSRPSLKGMLDEQRQHPPQVVTGNGAPRLHLIDGKVAGREKLDTDFFKSPEKML